MSTRRNRIKSSLNNNLGKTAVFEPLEQRHLLTLLGVGAELLFPDVYYDASGVASYNAATQALDSSATPTSVVFTKGGRPVNVKDPRDFEFHMRVDNQGQLLGGVVGSDLKIDGWLDINRNNVLDAGDYSGVLLTAEVVGFGYLDANINGSTDQYDFRLVPTGGVLMTQGNYFANQDIGLVMTSLNSTFANSFAVNFAGGSQGLLGPINQLRGSLGGQVFLDSDNNGANNGESGIGGATVALDGTDITGTAVHLIVQSAADGTYSFAGLLPGTYSLTQTLPEGYLIGAGSQQTIDVNLGLGQNGVGYNFADIQPGNLSGAALIEGTGIAGVSISLAGTDDLGGAVSVATATDAAGAYSFAGLRPGSYTISETQPAGYLDAAGAVNSYAVAVTSGSSAANLDFAEILPGNLSGAALIEGTGIAGVSISLAGTDDLGGAVSVATATDAAGAYSFAGLRPGSYTISETQPAGYLDAAGAVNSYAVAVTSGSSAANLDFAEILPGSVAGSVFVDADNDDVFDMLESGLSGVKITLTGADDLGEAVSVEQTTNAAGAYSFAGLRPGSYTITESQPLDYIDNVTGVNSQALTVASGSNINGLNFGEILPASLTGFVWEDFNDDGEIDFSEKAIAGVTVNLTGVDDRGAAVNVTKTTDADGIYSFFDLRPGTYTITETQAAGYADGSESLGTAGGVVGPDSFSGISLAMDQDGMNYNFGERTAAGSAVTSGQTATIGFWQNKNGQALLKSLNGGPTSTQMGNWLAETFPNMFASLAGLTNAQVAAVYTNAFKAKAVKGPAKFDCQVFSTAFAVYVTNSSLAGTSATKYGFRVTDYGVGIATFSVGTSGAAFGVANNTVMAVLNMLLATDARSSNGLIYNLDAVLRSLANAVYTAINEAGDIG